MKRKLFGSLGLFLLAASLPFITLTPQVARSAVRTTEVEGCREWTSGTTPIVDCPVTTGSDFMVSALVGVYFDFFAPAQAKVPIFFFKTSYTGTLYVDQALRTSTGGYQDWFLAAQNVKTNPSLYDYVSAQIQNATGLVGIAAVTQ